MHNLHANNINKDSHLQDDSISRIAEVVNKKASRGQKKAAAKADPVVPQDTAPEEKRIVVASLKEIPSSFEAVGTGFFREGHHLWEMSTEDGKLVLTRKFGEDATMNDAQPVHRQASTVQVKDSVGNILKIGSRVTFPNNGKIASGDVLVLAPSVITVQTESGAACDVPPMMCEEQVMEMEPHVEEPMEEEMMAESPTIEACEEFEPTLEPSSKMEEHVEVPEEHMGNASEEHEETPHSSEGDSGMLAMTAMLKKTGGRAIITSSDNKWWVVAEVSPNKFTATDLDGQSVGFDGVDAAALGKFATKIGAWKLFNGTNAAAVNTRTANTLSTWEAYWYNKGKQAGSKPLTQEQKEKRKIRRKQRSLENTSWKPQTTKTPKVPKSAQMHDEEMEMLVKRLDLYKQMVEELNFILQDETLKTNEQQLSQEVHTTLENTAKQLEELDKEEEQEQPAEEGALAPEPEATPELMPKMSFNMKDI